jgi:hypothetical protein
MPPTNDLLRKLVGPYEKHEEQGKWRCDQGDKEVALKWKFSRKIEAYAQKVG